MLGGIETKLTIIAVTPLALLMVFFYYMSLLPAMSYMQQYTQ